MSTRIPASAPVISFASPAIGESSFEHQPPPMPTTEVGGQVTVARHELTTVLRYWGQRPEMWQLIGFTASATDPLAPTWLAPDAHPIVELMQSPVVVRRQSLNLSERDAIERHGFMRYLAERGLPVPALLERPDGSTYALAPLVPLTDPQQPRGITYVIENGIYEVQAYVTGRRYITDGPGEDMYLQAAARTLGVLHHVSLDYRAPARDVAHEHTFLAISTAYLRRLTDIGQVAKAGGVPRSIATELRRLARETAPRLVAAAERLDARQDLPWLYVHGDYQPHNLAFADDRVRAIYDFETAHWDRRLLGLAYALMAFAGLRWEDDDVSGMPSATPPLAEHGLDLERARAFLAAYGQFAPPEPGEADALADALLVVMPIIFANGVAEDIVFAHREQRPAHPTRECLTHVAWAETFPEWIAEHGAALRAAWQHGEV